jgi:hypothetical protein
MWPMVRAVSICHKRKKVSTWIPKPRRKDWTILRKKGDSTQTLSAERLVSSAKLLVWKTIFRSHPRLCRQAQALLLVRQLSRRPVRLLQTLQKRRGPHAQYAILMRQFLGQKRKRSDAEDSPLTSEESDIEQSPRKRSQGPSTHPLEGEIAQSTEPNGADDAQEIEEAEIAEVEDVEVPAVLPTKGFKGKRGRKPGRKSKVQEEVEEAETADPAAGIEGDEPAEPEPKSEEELKQKGEASSSFEDLARQFTAFRQRLVNESLASVEHELQLLNQPDCIHPEFLRQVSCIDERRAKQIREANAFYRYRMQSVRQRTLGERAQLHSQYFQTARELRENMLYELGEDWYGIQKERRQQHQEGEERFLYKLPSRKSAQIRQQAKYNQEVSVLSGVAKYVGFPAAPNISGVEGSGLEDDFKAMRVSGCTT